MATGHDSLILRYSGLELPDEQSFYKHLVSKNFEVRATKDVFYAELVYDNFAPAWMENVRETLERTRAGFCNGVTSAQCGPGLVPPMRDPVACLRAAHSK
ncbi:hypothetical protein AFUB_081280 [Aspergillus fumigatus A1163]|uniref:Uncharacterized protein n=1 Tax=Aspergillus fumigatus (strain CBS 144.89 / FGSC A1163 / CEA10) TaxID=451804 RepID=B0Y9J7_ASPFC|nr:hypothetical protein AFUB_081280 [Aspergillus fumigatus A1163]